MVIPGNIGYLNQFFSVQIFTENAAPTWLRAERAQRQSRIAPAARTRPPRLDELLATR
jgi:hypothetical protein